MPEINKKTAIQLAAERETELQAELELRKKRRKVFGYMVLATVAAYALLLILLPLRIIPAQYVLPIFALFTIELIILWVVMKAMDRRDNNSTHGQQ